jgi:hypothetical protein
MDRFWPADRCLAAADASRMADLLASEVQGEAATDIIAAATAHSTDGGGEPIVGEDRIADELLIDNATNNPIDDWTLRRLRKVVGSTGGHRS